LIETAGGLAFKAAGKTRTGRVVRVKKKKGRIKKKNTHLRGTGVGLTRGGTPQNWTEERFKKKKPERERGSGAYRRKRGGVNSGKNKNAPKNLRGKIWTRGTAALETEVLSQDGDAPEDRERGVPTQKCRKKMGGGGNAKEVPTGKNASL